jgi:hypothetical protein
VYPSLNVRTAEPGAPNLSFHPLIDFRILYSKFCCNAWFVRFTAPSRLFFEKVIQCIDLEMSCLRQMKMSNALFYIVENLRLYHKYLWVKIQLNCMIYRSFEISICDNERHVEYLQNMMFLRRKRVPTPPEVMIGLSLEISNTCKVSQQIHNCAVNVTESIC